MKTLLDLLGWNATRPLIVFEKEPGFSGSGGTPSPSSVAQSAVQGVQSVTQDPAVATTGENLGTQTRGSSPRPPTRPSALDKKVYDATGNLAKDLHMGFSTLFQDKEKQAETLKEKGYSDEEIKKYQERTAASQEAMRQSMMNSGGDDNDSSPAPAPAPTPAPAPVVTAPTPTPPPAPAPISEDTSAPEEGSAEAEVLAQAGVEADGTPTGRGRRGRASTIETTPQGLITPAKTTKKKSLMNKMIA